MLTGFHLLQTRILRFVAFPIIQDCHGIALFTCTFDACLSRRITAVLFHYEVSVGRVAYFKSSQGFSNQAGILAYLAKTRGIWNITLKDELFFSFDVLVHLLESELVWIFFFTVQNFKKFSQCPEKITLLGMFFLRQLCPGIRDLCHQG